MSVTTKRVLTPWSDTSTLMTTRRARPGASLVTRRVEAGDLGPFARIGPFSLLDDIASQYLQDRVAGQTGDIPPVGLGLDPLHHLRVGKVAVTAKDHQGVGPRLTQPLDQAFQHRQ